MSALPAGAVGLLQPLADDDADLERRFGGLRRLYGNAAYLRIRAAHVAVVGVGGVGSWTAEALARSGVAALTLVDLDHVSESNVNRQVQALGSTLGMAKVEALRARIADIHPGCIVHAVEEFADPANWPGLLPEAVDWRHLVEKYPRTALAAAAAAGFWLARSRSQLVLTAIGSYFAASIGEVVSELGERTRGH